MIATSARRFRSLVCCLATAAVAGIALADVPAALDRVPENFEGVVAVPSIEKFEATMVQSLKDLPLGGGGMSVEIQENLSRITETPGVNKQGSVAIFRMPMNAAAKAAAKAKKAEADKAADAGEETDFFAKMEADQAKAREAAERVLMLVPVSDYKAFVEALKGNAADAVAEVTFNMGEAGAEDVDGADADMNKAFVRNIGGGYALMGPSKSTVADFKPVEGKLKAHSEFLGATGRKIAEESLVLAIGNIAEMKDDISGTFSGLDKNPQIAMATAGAGDQAKKGLATIEMVANNFARDARVGIVGVGLDEKGIWIDFAIQFKDGSELAGFFQDKGNVAPIVDRLPNQTFVTMIALDTAGTGMKKLLGEIAKSGGEEAAAMMSGLNTADKMDGFGWMMGASPAGLMGLFSSTSSFTMVKDPQAYLAEVKKSYEAMDGKKIAGMTYKSVYTPEASSIDGVKVDNYTVTQTPDPNDPDAQQALMLQSMMGGGGPTTGLYAPVEGGVVATYSKNNLLMKEAINTAKTAKGVSTTDDVKMLQAYLPADRTMEGYIGVKPVMEMALGAMMMFGMEMDVQLPEKITPIAFGATTSDGAFRARVFVPHDVIAAVGELGKTMQEGMQDQMMPGAEDEEGQAPGF